MKEENSLSDAIRIRIKSLAKENHLSILQLSGLAGIPYSTISSFLVKRCSSLTVSTLFKICGGLGISLNTFFDDEIFNDVS